MDNPLFPSADDAMGPGERRRAALRQAALRTAPALTDHQPEQQPSADSVPEPRTPRPHLSTPFSDGSSQTAGGQAQLLQSPAIPLPLLPSPWVQGSMYWRVGVCCWCSLRGRSKVCCSLVTMVAEEQLPPAFPWETAAASGAPPANPFTFSSHMPSSKGQRPPSSAAVPPRTPSKGPGSPRTSFDSLPAAANAAQASPLRSSR